MSPTVSSTGASAAPPAAVLEAGRPEPGAAPQPATQPAAQPGVTKEEFDALKAQLDEQQRAAQFWFEKASKTGAGGQEPGAAPEPEVDLLDLITTKGVKGFDEFMKKRGYASREEVDALVNSKAAQLAKESDLISRYPELKRKDSEFFKATALHYGDLVKQGVPQTVAMEVATERAELEGIRTGKVKTPQQKEADASAEREADRRARANAQMGDRGGRKQEGTEEDEELTAEQKHIIAAMGISEEAYKKRAKEGVRMATRIAR